MSSRDSRRRAEGAKGSKRPIPRGKRKGTQKNRRGSVLAIAAVWLVVVVGAGTWLVSSNIENDLEAKVETGLRSADLSPDAADVSGRDVRIDPAVGKQAAAVASEVDGVRNVSINDPLGGYGSLGVTVPTTTAPFVSARTDDIDDAGDTEDADLANGDGDDNATSPTTSNTPSTMVAASTTTTSRDQVATSESGAIERGERGDTGVSVAPATTFRMLETTTSTQRSRLLKPPEVIARVGLSSVSLSGEVATTEQSRLLRNNVKSGVSDLNVLNSLVVTSAREGGDSGLLAFAIIVNRVARSGASGQATYEDGEIEVNVNVPTAALGEQLRTIVNATRDAGIQITTNIEIGSGSEGGILFAGPPLARDIDRIVSRAPITFRRSTLELSGTSDNTLDAVATAILRNPGYVVEIAVFADSEGIENENLTLSRRRAEFLADLLIEQDIDPERLVANGFGSRGEDLSNPGDRFDGERVFFVVTPQIEEDDEEDTTEDDE